MDIISILITLIVFAVVFWAADYILGQIPGIPPFIAVIVRVLIGVAFLIWALRLLLSLSGHSGVIKLSELAPLLIG